METEKLKQLAAEQAVEDGSVRHDRRTWHRFNNLLCAAETR